MTDAEPPYRRHYVKSGLRAGELKNDEAAQRRKCRMPDCPNEFWAWPGAPDEYCPKCQAEDPELRPGG